MAKKSKSKNSGGNTSNAKNIKALINQNKMVEQQNAEAERRKREEEEARAAAKREKEEALKAQEEAKQVSADQVISPEGEVSSVSDAEAKPTKEPEKKVKGAQEKEVSKKDLKAKKKADPERRTMKKRIKETMSELKKVSWPSFKDVVKKTGVVLAVVIFFGIVLWIFDFVGHIFYNLLQGSPLL